MNRLFLLSVFLFSFLSVNIFAEEIGERLTQEQFAVELVKAVKLSSFLPTAALPSDCVSFLERLGIAPFGGWKNKALMTQEDYLVVMAKIHGKEGLVFEKAALVEEKNIAIINQKWQEAYDKSGRWMPLVELLRDKTYFPQGALESPYKLSYEDKNNDHKVDPHFYPAAFFVKP